ncbi:MAG: histidinol dehydrogenase [Gammaproteobacteria bacterium]|nr:histidinol dehydrogenase [Gammaproteobacteria bacterium]
MISKTRHLDTEQPGFDADLSLLLDREMPLTGDVRAVVMEIIQTVKESGDQALIEYTNRFDRRGVESFNELEVNPERLETAKQRITPEVLEALENAAARIRAYHERQKQESWRYTDSQGNQLGQLIRPLDCVGVYAPGGKASYPSSVLMTVIPAKVAGVDAITLMAPCPGGELNETVLAAAAISGVDKFFTVGGAQAIAALAYGTRSVSAVDKIVGPGNIYVATAKQLVFGRVGIDMIAGPSEVVVIADNSASPEWLVMDLFAQAEHDEQAQAILISPYEELLKEVDRLIADRVGRMDRSVIIEKSLRDRGALIKVRDLGEAVDISNRIAPEHLELAIEDPESVLDYVRHAGAIFLGKYSAECIGDYSAGPSHVLPTAGTARFSSPLGVYDFQKRSSLIKCSKTGAQLLGRSANVLAREEGLIAHALSAQYRIKE